MSFWKFKTLYPEKTAESQLVVAVSELSPFVEEKQHTSIRENRILKSVQNYVIKVQKQR